MRYLSLSIFFLFILTFVLLVLAETISPTWKNQGTNDTDNIINQGQAINLTAQGKDETALDWAWLSTNETGSWKNYTSNTGTAWWNTSFLYRKQITITGSTAGAQTNYQMLLYIYNSTGTDSGSKLYLGSKVKNDFSDIRFTNSSNSLLDYWIESINSTTATVWVEFDSIPASPNNGTFYIYYNSSSAASASNGNTTFVFFDDFSGTSLDLSKWGGDTNSASVSGGILTLSGNSKTIYTLNAFSENIAFHSYSKISSLGSSNQMGLAGFADVSFSNTAYQQYGDNHNCLTTKKAGSYAQIETDWTPNAWKYIDICLVKGTKERWYESGSERTNSPYTTAAYIPTADLSIILVTYGTGANYVYADFVLVRRYADPEPTWGSCGDEENYTFNNENNIAVKTNLTVASGQVKLTAYCSGTPTACSSFSSHSTCIAQSGCSGATCSGTPTACSSFGYPGTCYAQSGCSWTFSSCAGPWFNCNGLDQGICNSCTAVCTWIDVLVACGGPYYGAYCTELGESACSSCGFCTANYVCSGTPTACSSLSSQSTCQAQSGCSWTACAGTATACSSFSSSGTCSAQSGCSWTYYPSGQLWSKNILSSSSVPRIQSFGYNASSIPSGTTLLVQFSQDNSTWYNSSGSLSGWDSLSSGANIISLFSLGWSGPNFYYKIKFTSSGTNTAVLDDTNVTVSVYNSPMSMTKDSNWQWSNFTWKNSSVAPGTLVGWKIYYNDTSNNTNVTDIMTFRIKLPPPKPCVSDVKFSINPNFAPPSSYVSPYVYGAGDCDNKIVYFTDSSCSDNFTAISSCTISGGACEGTVLQMPDSSGAYTYHACIDKNIDGDFSGSGEDISLIYMVGYSNLPEFDWIGLIQIMMIASVALIFFRKS